MKFSIRELLLLTLVAAMAAGWWVDRRMLAARLDRFEERIAPFEEEFRLIVMYQSDIAESLEARKEERRRQRLRDSLLPPEVIFPEATAESPRTTSSPKTR